jgi:hypothetical protein
MKGTDAQQFARAAARGRKVDLTSDCCCSRVVRLHVLASPGGEARAAASLFPHPTVTPPAEPHRTPPSATPPSFQKLKNLPGVDTLHKI